MIMNLDDMKEKRPVEQDRVDEMKEEMLDTVTITISRNEAEWWAMHRPMPEQFGNFFERQIQKACHEALEGEQ